MIQIPKIKLISVSETQEAREAIGYEYNQETGTRHFLGGAPDGGERPMSFYAQIDSIGDKNDLADCMVIHTYVCFESFTVKSILVQI